MNSRGVVVTGIPPQSRRRISALSFGEASSLKLRYPLRSFESPVTCLINKPGSEERKDGLEAVNGEPANRRSSWRLLDLLDPAFWRTGALKPNPRDLPMTR